MDNNGYPIREQIKDAAGVCLFAAFCYAAWCLVAVM